MAKETTENRRKRGRPKTGRMAKVKRAADLIGVCRATMYNCLAGTRGLGQQKAERAVYVLGGSLVLWRFDKDSVRKNKLFDEAEI